MSTQAGLRRRTMQRSTGQRGKLGTTMAVWWLATKLLEPSLPVAPSKLETQL